MAEAGIDGSPLVVGSPSQTQMSKCIALDNDVNVTEKFEEDIENQLPTYMVTGQCEKFVDNENDTQSYRVCVLLKLQGMIHIYYEDKNDKLRCHMVPIQLDPTYNLNENPHNKSDEIAYNIQVSPGNLCDNITCTLTLNLNPQSINQWLLDQRVNFSKSDLSQPKTVTNFSVQTPFIENDSIRSWYKDYWVSKPKPSTSTSNWLLNFTCSVGAPQNEFSGIYSLHGVSLTYILSEKFGFRDLKPADAEREVVIANWTMHRMRARAEEHYICVHEVHVQLFETNNTRVNPYDNETAHYMKKNLHLLHSEAIRGLIVFEKVTHQLFSFIFNATRFHGDNTHCLADEKSEHTIPFITFGVLVLLVFCIGLLQCFNNCKEKEKASKKAEEEGLYVFQQHQQRYPYAPLPLHTQVETPPNFVKVLVSSSSDEEEQKQKPIFPLPRIRLTKSGLSSPTPSMLFNAAETIAEVTEDERKSSLESTKL
ncbi:hypothetical protein Ciccas_008880 [Cichlidogyrus casuarinus]|uniref:Uncharacterized protein n=1 Tax=Cichlidogyrus casuarinus TaxID=1844966 RepID=A0ABD2PYQ7_9PLAT